ncbi:ArsA family ATPase [bacterium]|nr:ArsA family ATPase [bacterium]
MSLLSRLENAKVIVSAGTGGVGKTTVSAALGVLMARQGKKVLVLTIDPAKRLAQALGLDGPTFEPKQVEGIDGAKVGTLYASMIDAETIFDKFVDKFAPNANVVNQLKKNRLYQQLVTALTGSQEFTSMDRLLTEYEEGNYDLIILDTPPTQNAVDFLRAPQRIVQLFDERITKWFIRGGEKSSFISKIVSRGTHTALAALEKITGAEFISELSDFFEQMSFLQASVKERSRRVEGLLQKKETLFLVVASADQEKLREAKRFGESLKDYQFHLEGMILNRVYPEWFHQGKEMTSPSKFFGEVKDFYRSQMKAVEKFKSENPKLAIFSLMESDQPMNGLKDIVKLSRELEEI